MAVTWSTIRAWIMGCDDAAQVEWILRRNGRNRSRGRDVHDVVVSHLKVAGLLTDDGSTEAAS